MSELLDKQVHAQEEKNFRGSRCLSNDSSLTKSAVCVCACVQAVQLVFH